MQASERPTLAATRPSRRTEVRKKPKTDPPRAWNVVLLDDGDHTYEYVIRMMMELFAHGPEKAFTIAQAVDAEGRAVCLTTHKERAEFKRDQVLSYGKDALIAGCAGSMSAVIEPAEGDEYGQGPAGHD